MAASLGFFELLDHREFVANYAGSDPCRDEAVLFSTLDGRYGALPTCGELLPVEEDLGRKCFCLGLGRCCHPRQVVNGGSVAVNYYFTIFYDLVSFAFF